MYKFKISYIVPVIIACLLLSCSKGAKSVLEKADDATFIIYTFDEHGSPAGSGSGFFIDKEGTGITNYHVLDKSMKAVIKLKNGKEYEIDEVLASDKEWDIVKFSILNEDQANFSYLDFSSKEIEQGDKVYNLGAPMGLEQTFADGLVSSIRSDSHGQVAQVTIPISQGSSGSPIMNESGEVVAVATYKKAHGESLNFGVFINEEKLSMMNANPFAKANRQFNNKEGFIILNIPCDQGDNLVLNAIQFKSDATIVYMSYTNLDLSMNTSKIWCPIDYGDKGFYLEDKANDRKYYVVSSSLSSNNEEYTSVPIATVCKFQVNFPAVDKNINEITVSKGGNPKWSFSDIDLNNFRKSIKIDFENYQKEYAYSTMQEEQLEQAQAIFEGILDDNPEDIQALNALGIISYVIDNNQDAIKYFTEVIENHPNSSSGYLNRSCVYKDQEDFERAIKDLSKAISIDNSEPNLYMARADIYIDSNDWEKAKADIEKALSFDNASSSIDFSMAYYYKGSCSFQMGDNNSATKDLEKALKYTSDSKMEQIILATLEKISPQYSNDSDNNSRYGSSHFKGAIGTLAITMFLSISSEGKVDGWYYYNSRGPAHKLSLTGVYRENGQIVLHEFTQEGNNTGKFDGVYNDGVYKGTFYALADSQEYNFSLDEM